MKTLSLLLALPLGIALPGHAPSDGNSGAEATQRSRLAVYPYGRDLALRDRLIAKGIMYDDLGGWILGEADRRLGAGFRLLPALLPGEELVTVVAHDHSASRDALLAAGRPVWEVPGGRASFRAYPAGALEAGSLAGHSCHGSFRRVKIGEPIRPAAFRHPAGPASGGVQYAITPKPAIQTMVAQVSTANLLTGVNTLAAFGTRRHFEPGEVDAQNWILAQMNAAGLNTSLFDYDSGADVVVGELPGVTDPTKIVIIGGHYDSVNWAGSATDPAPGADDDASGVSAVLEMARILSNHSFDYTIRFCAWSGEELGLLGSEAYAADLASQGADVVGMVQLDMIAYRDPGDTLSVDFVLNDTTPSLNQFAMDAFQAYVPTLPVNSFSLSGGTSDHRSFFNHGFPATFPFEDETFSPFIHTANDVVGTSANDLNLAAGITQGALATVAELARPVSMLLTHVPLADTADEVGPYGVVVTAVPQNGETVSGGTLFYRKNEGAWQSVAMAATGNPDEWAGAIPGQTAPAFMDYYVVMGDTGGNQAWLPEAFNAGDAFYSFIVGTLTQVYFEDFDGPDDAGWTHGQILTQDDWMRGVPQGKAGDPAAAFSGANVWGNDLGPSGWNGFYQNDVDNWLDSPSIDCSGHTGCILRFQRWLGVEDAVFDQAIVTVNGVEFWRNPAGTNLVDTGWVEMRLDVSSVADNNANVTVRFELISDPGVTFGGWTLDDVEIIAVGGGGGPTINTILLTGPTSAATGAVIQYDWSGAPVSSPYWFYFSKRLNGAVVNGQPFDIGPRLKSLATGTTTATGTGAYTSPPIPGRFAGRTAYLEVRVDDAVSGQTFDSNFIQLDIL